MKKLTKTRLDSIFNKYIHLTETELKTLLEDVNLPILDRITAGILVRIAKDDDVVRFDFILNRLLGKVKEQIEHTVNKPTIIHRRDGTSVELGMTPILELPDGEPD